MSQQRLRLPPELVYELLSFVPSTFFGARHLLWTNAILYWLIIGGKYANNWRHPCLVGQREAQLASHQIGTINRRALCPRYHRDNYPLYFLNAHRYAHARPNGTIDIQAALILDVTLFTPGADMRRLRREMVRQINERSRAWEGVMLSCRPVLHLTLDFDTLVMNYSGVEDENFHASVTNVLNKLVELMDIDLPGNPPV